MRSTKGLTKRAIAFLLENETPSICNNLGTLINYKKNHFSLPNNIKVLKKPPNFFQFLFFPNTYLQKNTVFWVSISFSFSSFNDAKSWHFFFCSWIVLLLLLLLIFNFLIFIVCVHFKPNTQGSEKKLKNSYEKYVIWFFV